MSAEPTLGEWHSLKELFARASELEGADRRTFVAGVADAGLRGRLVALLAADEAGDDFIEPPGVEPAGEDDDGGQGSAPVGPPPDAGAVAPGSTVGAYRIVERLGSGGMGEVLLAERADGEFQKRVAIKVLKRGMDTEELLRRFANERQALASLEHPGIARLLDAGSLADGRPYLVMELVHGTRIDAFCDEHQLDTRERLALFLEICAAVQHAHAKLVVHRDLKPANILVTADGTPKLLDFGVAKLVRADGPELTRTGAGRLPMTLEYASPEQICGGPVSTAADVYSLGVILYELLCGHRPYRYSSSAELERAVCEVEPDRPSAQVTQPSTTVRQGRVTTRTAHELGALRRATPHALRRVLDGDLDNIVLMALRKEPERRYVTVAQLSDDVERFLCGRPVTSRPATLTYRARKFVRRNRLGLAVAATAAALVVAAVVGLAFENRATARALERAVAAQREAERARGAADEAGRRAETVTGFLADMLAAVHPAEEGKDVTVAELLDRTAATVHESLGDEPLVEAAIRSTVGQSYLGLGRLKEAERELRAALELLRRHGTPGSPELIQALNDVGVALDAQRRADEAAAFFEEALALQEARSDVAPEDLALTLNNLGVVRGLAGRPEEAEDLLRRALELRLEALGPDHLDVAESLNNLSRYAAQAGDLAEAERLLRESLRIRRLHLAEDHPLIAQSLSNLAVALAREGRLDEAEELQAAALDRNRERLGDEHPDVATDLSNLGAILREKGDLEGASVVFGECLELRRRLFPSDHLLRGVAGVNYGSCLLDLGRPAEAAPVLVEALPAYAARLGERHEETLALLREIVRAYHALGQDAEAEAYDQRLRSPE